MNDQPSGLEPENQGGSENIRGMDFQDYSLLYYILIRLVEYSKLTVYLETREDALIHYPDVDGRPIDELVQCKKIEQRRGNGRPGRPGFGGTIQYPGTFGIGDFRDTVQKERCGRSIERDLGRDESTFVTVLLSGELAGRLKRYCPPQSSHLYGPTLNKNFPADYQHPKDPAHLSDRGLASEGVRRRIRLICMPTAAELRAWCHILLQETYRVPENKFSSLLRKLREILHERSGAIAKEDKTLKSAHIDALLAQYSLRSGGWTAATDWLRKERNTVADINRGEDLGWRDLAEGRYVDRPQFHEAREALGSASIVRVNGYVGSGKTTLARFLAYQHLCESPDHRAYYLRLKPGRSLVIETRFLEEQLDSPVLFILDDDQMNPQAADTLLTHYLDRRTRSSGARVLVLSTERFRRRLVGGGGRENPYREAQSVQFAKSSRSDLTGIIRELRAKCGFQSPLSDGQIATLAGGWLGLAILVGRAVQNLRDSPANFSVVRHPELRQVIEEWLLNQLQTTGEVLERELRPILILHSFGFLPLEGDFKEGIELLRRGGVLLENSATEVPSFDLDASLSYLITQTSLESIPTALGKLFKHDKSGIGRIFDRLSKDRFGYGPLADFCYGWWNEVLDTLLDELVSTSLSDVATVLRGAYRVRRSMGRRLWRELAAPMRALRAGLLTRLLRLNRTKRPTDVSAFFQVTFAIDRELSRRIAEAQLGARERDFLLEIFDLPSSTLPEIALALRSLRRCSRSFEQSLWTSLKESPSFEAKLASQLEHPTGLLPLLRYCSSLYPARRRTISNFMEATFTLDKVLRLCVEDLGESASVIFLMQLQRIRPRLASRVLERIWRDRPRTLTDPFQEQPNLEALAYELVRIRSISPRVARNLAFSSEDSIRALVTEEGSYRRLASGLNLLKGVTGWSFASAMSKSSQREAILSSIDEEVHKLSLVGLSLRNLARIDSELAGWLEERLDLRDLALKVVQLPMLNLSSLMSGLLAAVPPERRAEVRDRYFSDGRLRAAFARAWRTEVYLDQAILGLHFLVDCQMPSETILEFLGPHSFESFKEDVRRRFKQEPSLQQKVVGLYQLSQFSDEIAEEVLRDYVATLDRQRQANKAGQPGPGSRRRARRTFPRHDEPNDLVQLGTLLRISAAINSDLARRIATGLDLDRIVSAAKEEINLGRLAVFLSGLHASSRKIARCFLDEIGGSEWSSRQFEENELIVNSLHFARTASRVSQSWAKEYMSFIIERFGDSISQCLEHEANVMQVSDWLRMIADLGLGSEFRQADSVRTALIEASDYDREVRHLLEATEALFECGFQKEARHFAALAREEAYQLKGLRRLGDFLVLCQKAVLIESWLSERGFVEDLLANVDNLRFSWMLAMEVSQGAGGHPLLPAFAFRLLTSIPSLGRFAAVMRESVPSVQGLGRNERRILFRSMIEVLCPSNSGELEQAAKSPGWRMPWERGLALVGCRCLSPDREAVVASGVSPEEREWLANDEGALSEHPTNVEFGLSLELARQTPGVPEEILQRAILEAEERAAEESRSAVVWLLRGCSTEDGTPPLYYLWWLMKESALQATYLPWGGHVEMSARERALREDWHPDLGVLAQ